MNNWEAKFKAMGHEPILDEDGNVDHFAYSVDRHNGPQCKKCGYGFCYHCDPDGADIPRCNPPMPEAERNEYKWRAFAIWYKNGYRAFQDGSNKFYVADISSTFNPDVGTPQLIKFHVIREKFVVGNDIYVVSTVNLEMPDETTETVDKQIQKVLR